MTSKTIEEKLDSMNIEEYELLLKGIKGTDKSRVLPEHAKIIDQIQHQMKTKPEEAITSLTNSKHSSSLQSLVQKEKGKNHHKVPNNSSRPDDSYQQQQNQSQTNTSGSKTVIPYNTSQSSSATVGAKQLPARYFFNCVQDDGDPFPNQERPPEADGERSSESRNINIVSRCADLHDDRSGVTNKSNIELRENYPAVESCIARPPFNESLRGQFKGSTNSNLTSSSLMPNYPALISAQTLSNPQAQVVSPANSLITSGFSSSPPPSNSARGSSDGSSRRLDETHGRKKAKAKDKEDKKVNSYKAPVTQYNAETDVDKILIQLEGPSIEGKRGNKNKKRGVKSMSLDDDNLSIAAKKTADRVTALKTTANNNSNNNNNSHNIQSSSSSSGKGEENKKDNNLNIDKEPFKGSSSSPPQGININNNNINTNNNNNSKRNSGSQASGERESDGEDNRSPVRSKGDVNFTLVIRGKRKNNKTASTSSSIGNPVGKGDDRQEDSSRKGRSRGERRKSVGSVPGSDQSEGSDDGSVRSLPAGECTKRENIPKSCASSGGTPQTSYADIARLTKDEDTKKEVPQALEDYPSLQAFENSEGSDDSSDRFIPTEDLAAAPATIKDGAGGKQSSNVVTTGSALTSYADIARLASHEEQKKEESNNNKKDQASEEFPELNSSTSLTQQQESSSAEPSSSLVSPSSDLSAGKYPSSDSSAFPQLIATTSSATSFKSNSSSQGSSNIKNMSSVVSSSAVAGAAAKVTNSLVAPAPASSTSPAAPTPTTTTTIKAQTNSIASPTVVSAASSAATKSTDHKNNVTTNVTGGGAGNPVVVSAAAALNPRVSLASPSSVAVVNSSSSAADNVLQGGGGGTNSKSNPDRHNSPPALHSNASKDSSSPICVNGHLSDSERDMKVMKRSDIPGAKMMMTMDKSSISIDAPTQQLNVIDSGLSQCTEAVVFCGENFKEPPQLPSKGLQFEFGFNVSEVLDDINKKVSPDAAVPPTGISVKHTKGNNNNLPSPPQKDGGYHSSKGYHHHGSSNKQQQHQQGGYGPRSNRGEDPRHRGGEVVVDRNGSSGRVQQNNNRSDSQGQRKIMPHASAHYNEVDDSSSKPPASGGGAMSDAQVVSAKSDGRLPSTGMSERSQSFKAAQPKAAGHNSKKSSFQTLQPVFADGVVQPPDPAQTPPSLLPSSEVVYSKQQPTIVSQYPLGAAPIAIHGGGGPGVPPVYGVTGYVTASASPSNYSNRLPAPPPHMTGPPFVPPPQPYEATQTPPQYIQQVYSIRTAPAPVATTTGHQEDHSTTGNAQPPQMPLPTGPVVVNADYLMNLSASSTTTSHPHHGPPARQPQQSTVVHSQRGFNHQVPAHHHHHHQQHHHHHQHNYSANVVDNAGSSSVFTSEGREVNSAATTTTTTVTGSLTYPIDFASRFVSPDPSRYSSANVEDLRNYLTRRQRECQRLRNENENVREIT